MSWRDYANVAQDAILDVMAERDPTGALSVTYEPVGGDPRVIRAIFREPHVEVVLEPLTVPVSTWETYLDCKIAELLPDWPLHPDSVFRVRRPHGADPLDSSAEVVYGHRDVQLDGEGLVRVYLRPA